VAHLRSHTGEKPFYCNVPGTSLLSYLSSFFFFFSTKRVCVECDKSFTRSDALAKHMRTVHEIEAGRPQEPVQKSSASLEHKMKRRRSPFSAENGHGDNNIDPRSDGDDPEHGGYSSTNRYRYLKRKLRWALERNASLKEDLQSTEERQWKYWAGKERMMDQLFAKEGIQLPFDAPKVVEVHTES
jgi:hypothetical protein